jgi:hypothetical protein
VEGFITLSSIWQFRLLVLRVSSVLSRVCLAQNVRDTSSALTDCYEPIPGGWSIRISADPAANGFENLGGGSSGAAGSSQVQDMTKPIAVDTEAHLVPFELRLNMKLRSVRIEAIANDVIFGVLGATVLK